MKSGFVLEDMFFISVALKSLGVTTKSSISQSKGTSLVASK
jgi:hypothetical protein